MNYQKTIPVAILITVFLLSAPVFAYPNQAVALYNEGNAILANVSMLKPNISQEQQALLAYNHSLEIAPDYYEAWNGKADALNRMGQYTEALEASNRSLGINNTYVPAWINRGEILYMIGFQYEDRDKNPATAAIYYNEQIAAFKKATALDPGNAVAWFNLGFALAGENRYDEAIAAFDKVRSLEPAYPHLDYYEDLAKKSRDAALPFYIKYAPWIVGGLALAVGAGVILWSRRKIAVEPEGNRKTRRRREK